MSIQEVESWMKVGGLIAGSLFFIWKLCTGWLIVNMGVCIRIQRQRRRDGIDDLTVTVALEKGSTDSIWLRDVEVRMTALENGELSDACVRYVRIHGFDRVAESSTQTVAWGAETDGKPIAISPGEKVEYSGHAVVSAEHPYLLEAVVLADRPLFRVFMGRCIQWRASAVSLPVPDAGKAINGGPGGAGKH